LLAGVDHVLRTGFHDFVGDRGAVGSNGDPRVLAGADDDDKFSRGTSALRRGDGSRLRRRFDRNLRLLRRAWSGGRSR
jgi:hypothetical protein